MYLDALTEQASRRLPMAVVGRQQAAQPIEGFQLLRWDTPSPMEAWLYEPVLCLILQGRKHVTIAGQTLTLGRGECLLVSHDLHVRSRITTVPYLALVFKIDVALLRSLYDEVADATNNRLPARAAEVHPATPELLDALGRYMALAASPADAKVLGPLIAREIHYRLLVAPCGGMLRSLIRHDSHASAVARAIGHLRGDVRSPIAIPDLARRVSMSPSSFHKHFKTITGTTPLQYHKELRLLEARRLLKEGSSVAGAAYEVGYESPSQFCREYARKFGLPPTRDRSAPERLTR
jgi:AraC-like DNA-binding protein